MSWRLRVEHATRYAYAKPVVASYNEVRLLPQTDRLQLTLESKLETSPAAPQYRYWDCWGTLVIAFDVHTAHRALEVRSTSVVNTATELPLPTDGPDWSVLRNPAVRDTHVEWLGVGARTYLDEPMAEAADTAARLATPASTVRAVCDLVRERVAYRPGATGVQTSATEAWRIGEGVCQDIAHVSIALLRRAGVPARYVSGYLHPLRDAPVGESVLGESHAWIEVWLGDWYAIDPTNGVSAGSRHVVVARGRDYADVPPFKGIYSGGGKQELSVSVAVTRLA
ncbi:MAG: transglutaminase family protein [Actinomycetota bacterium]|nr:transglutaminase family protein [Actinomycetota bacterium]